MTRNDNDVTPVRYKIRCSVRGIDAQYIKLGQQNRKINDTEINIITKTNSMLNNNVGSTCLPFKLD